MSFSRALSHALNSRLYISSSYSSMINELGVDSVDEVVGDQGPSSAKLSVGAPLSVPIGTWRAVPPATRTQYMYPSRYHRGYCIEYLA